MSKEELELLKLSQSGDTQAMNEVLNLNKSWVRSLSRKYFLLGGDNEDLIQEGMIGLFNAIKSYDESKNDNFKSYAIRVVKRAIISAIRRENTGKNQMLDNCMLVDSNEYLPDDSYPEVDVLVQERYSELLAKMKENLSHLESEVFDLYLEGFSYVDIANHLQVETKAVDNAMSRIRHKLDFLKERK